MLAEGSVAGSFVDGKGVIVGNLEMVIVGDSKPVKIASDSNTVGDSVIEDLMAVEVSVMVGDSKEVEDSKIIRSVVVLETSLAEALLNSVVARCSISRYESSVVVAGTLVDRDSMVYVVGTLVVLVGDSVVGLRVGGFITVDRDWVVFAGGIPV